MRFQVNELISNYILELKEIETALFKKDFGNKKLARFWRGLVRDPHGKWLKYYFEGYKYFQYGIQSKPDLDNHRDVELLKAAINQQRSFLTGIQTQKYEDFKLWLISLHKKQIYNGNKVKFCNRRRFALIIHSKIVLGEVLPLAKKYQDLYSNKGIQKVQLLEIDKNGLPKDVWLNDNEVIHYYPDPKYFEEYLTAMKKTLQELLNLEENSENEVLNKIAAYYQYAINTHMFENINQSLFANQANALLHIFGYEPISHGILDFAAMRLQPKSFNRYFLEEVINEMNKEKQKSRLRSDSENFYLKLAKKV